jgi:hypothetical protein
MLAETASTARHGARLAPNCNGLQDLWDGADNLHSCGYDGLAIADRTPDGLAPSSATSAEVKAPATAGTSGSDR